MCANSEDHQAWIAASQAGDKKSAEAIAAGRMTAAQYYGKVKASRTKKGSEEPAPLPA